ncbi:hypothetical protein SprV_0100190100 [Sparganum proliferum]
MSDIMLCSNVDQETSATLTVTDAEQRLLLTKSPFRLDALPIVALEAAGICSRPKARSKGRAGDQGDLQRRWLYGPPTCHLQDEASFATPQKTISSRLTQQMEEMPAVDENAPVETRWYQLRDAVHSTALAVHGREHCQHQGWFNGNDAAISNLLAKKNRLNRAYLDRPIDANKAAFYQCRHLAQQRLVKIQDSWMVRKAKDVQRYTDCNESKKFFTTTKATYGHPTKRTAPLLGSDGSVLLLEKSQILKRWLNTSEASSTVPPKSSTPLSTGSPRGKSAPIWISSPLSQKPSALCNNSPAGQHPAPMRSQLKSTSTAATD